MDMNYNRTDFHHQSSYRFGQHRFWLFYTRDDSQMDSHKVSKLRALNNFVEKCSIKKRGQTIQVTVQINTNKQEIQRIQIKKRGQTMRVTVQITTNKQKIQRIQKD